MLVLDGGAGQNAINQAKEFNKAVKLSGISITKLDGTAKGGIDNCFHLPPPELRRIIHLIKYCVNKVFSNKGF
jgi:hypothetical protein